MRPTDQMLSRISAEIEEKQSFIDGVVESAEKEGRDLTAQEMELVTRSKDRQGELNEQAKPMQEAARIAIESQERVAQIGKLFQTEKEKPAEVEYRTAGAYILDYWKAALGAEGPKERLELYERTAAHQLTTDNPGLLPTPIVQPVVNFIDGSRPMTTWLGPKQIPSNSWVRPKVTQHTAVAVQTPTEKTELTSQKMTIAKQTVTAATYGGYVNVSRQDIDWSTPSIMDIVINDLAAQYAITTEGVLCDAVVAAAATTETIPTGAATVAQLTAALWEAAGLIFTATQGQGRLAMFVSSDHLGLWAPLFAPVNPQSAQSPGFEAANFGTGAMGQIAGIPVYMSAGLDAASTVVLSSAAVEVYEDRIGSLQVIEPSVLGVQVAYAGYYTYLVVETAGLAQIIKTP